jgi:hypothetical protein
MYMQRHVPFASDDVSLRHVNAVFCAPVAVTSSMTGRHGSSFVDATPADDQGGASGGKKVIRITTVEVSS